MLFNMMLKHCYVPIMGLVME